MSCLSASKFRASMLQVGLATTRARSRGTWCGASLALYSAAPPVHVRRPHLQCRAAESALPRPRPLDEGDGIGAQVVVEQRRVLVLEALKAVEIEVGDRHPPALVALADREGGRGDRRGDAEGAAGAADQ